MHSILNITRHSHSSLVQLLKKVYKVVPRSMPMQTHFSLGFGFISGKSLWLLQQVFQQYLFIVAVLSEHNNSCVGSKGSHTGRVVLFVLPVFGQAMHALPPLRPSFALASSPQFLVGMLLLLMVVLVLVTTIGA